jgi:hypothetical protein
MNELRTYFEANEDKMILKWMHYFDVYDRYFSKFRGTDVHIVEIGIYQGGSLQMWKDYFGPEARIFGVDVNPDCKNLEEDRVDIFIGDQADRQFLKTLAAEIPRIDILLDDGGHTMVQQINTFEELFPFISEEGVYLCEDLHTSYWKKFGGGHQRKGTFIEYAKNFIDDINAWHSKESHFQVNDITRSAYGVHFYDSIVVVEKKKMSAPQHKQSGNQTIPKHTKKRGFWRRLEKKLRGKT